MKRIKMIVARLVFVATALLLCSCSPPVTRYVMLNRVAGVRPGDPASAVFSTLNASCVHLFTIETPNGHLQRCFWFGVADANREPVNFAYVLEDEKLSRVVRLPEVCTYYLTPRVGTPVLADMDDRPRLMDEILNADGVTPAQQIREAQDQMRAGYGLIDDGFYGARYGQDSGQVVLGTTIADADNHFGTPFERATSLDGRHERRLYYDPTRNTLRADNVVEPPDPPVTIDFMDGRAVAVFNARIAMHNFPVQKR